MLYIKNDSCMGQRLPEKRMEAKSLWNALDYIDDSLFHRDIVKNSRRQEQQLPSPQIALAVELYSPCLSLLLKHVFDGVDAATETKEELKYELIMELMIFFRVIFCKN